MPSHAQPRRATHFSGCTALVCHSWLAPRLRRVASARLKTRNQLCVFLRDPAHCEAFRTPGRGEEFLESVGFLRLSTDRCLGDSSLELEHFHLELPPGDGVPFIPMMCIMAHDVLTLRVDSPCVITVPLWAYPSHCRGSWLRGRSLHTEAK